jgi:diacylglycerol O-acyltransferase-1
LRRGVSKVKANFLVFLISAIAHEWLISAPLGILSFHAFFAMLTQAPIIFVQ